jgi:hypothetical protein
MSGIIALTESKKNTFPWGRPKQHSLERVDNTN